MKGRKRKGGRGLGRRGRRMDRKEERKEEKEEPGSISRNSVSVNLG